MNASKLRAKMTGAAATAAASCLWNVGGVRVGPWDKPVVRGVESQGDATGIERARVSYKSI